MKIAVSSTGTELTSEMDTRFGRAAFFLIIDPETMDVEPVENKQNINLPQGAGIQAGQIIADKKVDTLITGNCGPKAFRTLQAARIKVITDVSGRVVDAVNKFKNGELKAADEANVEGHW